MSDFNEGADRLPDEAARQREGTEGPPPALRRRPPVMTLAIILTIQFVAFAQFAVAGFRVRGLELGTMPGDWALGAKVPSLIANGEYWRLVTANFLHGSLFPHLLMNLLGLLFLGRLVELFYGSARMLVIFTLTAVCGTVASYLWTPNVSLGASTGIMGLLGALIAHHYRYRRFIPSQAARWLPWFIGIAILQTVMDTWSEQVDAYGHLGGLFSGYVLGWALEGRIAGKHQAERDWLPLPVGIASATALLAYGLFGLAIALPRESAMLRAASAPNAQTQVRLLREIASTRPDFVEARQELITLLALRGEVGEASREYHSLLKDHPAYESDEETRRALTVTVVRLYQSAVDDYKEGRNEDALAKNLLLLELTKNRELLADAHNTYAWILADRLNRNLDQAEEHALRATAMDPDNSAYLDTLAWVYYRQGRYEKALPLQQRAMKLADPVPAPLDGKANGEGYYHLAAILEKLGRIPEAIRYYGKAIGSPTATVPARAALQRLTKPQSPPVTPPVPAPTRPISPGIHSAHQPV